MSHERHHGYCALCISRCGCIGTVENGRLTRVDPDPQHPTGKTLCLKAKAAPEAVYAPERLLQPLRRTRPKDGGDPGWRAISWDEALDLIAERLRATIARLGPQGLAFAVATPSGTAVADSFGWIHRLAHACGSPNLVFATENCNWHKDFSPALTFGAGIGMPDYEHTGCILLWGFNPATTWLAQASAVQAARRRGARLIVVDPRRAGLAAAADLWLRPRPGTDGALALGLAHQLIARNAHDRDFLTRWSDAPFLVADDGRRLSEADLRPGGDPRRPLAWDLDQGCAIACPARPPNSPPQAPSGPNLALSGKFAVDTPHGPIFSRPVFARLSERCAEWPAARVADVTGVPADQLEAAAHLIATHRPLSFFTWTGTCQQTNATQTTRAINVLYGLTGDLDAPGGNVWFDKPPSTDIMGFDRVTPAERALTLGLAERPDGPAKKGWITTRDLFRAIAHGDPYPVGALLAFGSNPLCSKPQTRDAEAALSQLDFFVMADLVETPTARYADVLLPVCTAWEREGLQIGFQTSAAAESLVQLRPAFVPPQGESRSDTWIVFALAQRLGLAKDFFGGDPEAGLAAVLAPSGLTPAQLRAAPGGIPLPRPPRYRKYEAQGFATASGRLELYSLRLRELGHDPLPTHLPPAAPDCRTDAPASPQAGSAANFPLILTTAKWPQYCHSQQRHLPTLRASLPEPLLEIHPETAAARQIAEGDWLMVATAQGRMRARARLARHLAPEVVCAQYGWWQYEDGAGDANRLIDGECFDPLSGSNSLRCFPCQVLAIAPQSTPESAPQTEGRDHIQVSTSTATPAGT